MNIKVSDYTNGYRFYSRRSAKLIISKCGKIGDGFIILSEILLIISKNNYKIGTCSSLFLIFYGFFRIISELFREPDAQIGYLFNLFSMGTILSFLMILVGVIILVFVRKNEIKFKIF